MQMSHRAALNGVQLDEVDDRIMIRRVETGEGKQNYNTVSLPNNGSRVTGGNRDSIDIVVKFAIRLKKRSMEERETVLEKANAWAAAGGVLTTNYKTNRRIRVFMAQAATAGDPWDWTKDYQIVFRACGVPYWQEDTPVTVTQQNISSGNLSITVAGSAKTVLEATFKNTSGGRIDEISINTGESAISFSDLALANNETLIIDHTDTGRKCVLRLAIQGTGGAIRSVLDKRTGDDDLYIAPGAHSVGLNADGAGTITISSRGRFA